MHLKGLFSVLAPPSAHAQPPGPEGWTGGAVNMVKKHREIHMFFFVGSCFSMINIDKPFFQSLLVTSSGKSRWVCLKM